MALIDNLAFGYKLDEASGNALDVLGVTDLTENGSPGSAAGKVGNCRTFNGPGSQYFTVASSSVVQFGDINMTIAAWVQIASRYGSQDIISKDNGSSIREYIIGYGGSGDGFRFVVFDAATGTTFTQLYATTFGSPPLNTWCLVIFRHDSVNNTLSIQVNNGAVDSVSYSAGIFSGSAAFRLGGRQDPGAEWNGLIDEVYVWKGRVLTLDDATALWNGSAGLLYPFDGISFASASSSGYTAATTSFSGAAIWSGSARMLSVDVSMFGPGVTVTAMTYGGANCTFIGGQSTVTSFGRVESWRIVQADSGAPAAGSNTLSVTLSGSVAFAVNWVAYTGVHQTSPTEAFNSAQATNVGAANATVSITTVAVNDWVHGAVATDDASVTANQTTRNNVTGAGGSGADEDTGPITSPGATAISYTNVGALATWAIAGYAIRPTTASLPTPFTHSFLVYQAVNAASNY